MAELFQPAPLSTDPHYEKPFQFPLMKQIEEYAEEHDVSILAASKVVVPAYALQLPWRDQEYFQSAAQWQQNDLAENAPKSLLRQFDRYQERKGGSRHG